MPSRAQQVACLVASSDRGSAAPAADPLAVNNDAFTGVALDPSWLVFDTIPVRTVTVSGGEAHCTYEDGHALASGLWFDQFMGYLLYREITGNFDVVATLRVTDGIGGACPVGSYRLGALQAHDPDRVDERNYVSVGIGDVAQATACAEWKTTVTDESNSGVEATGDFGFVAWPSAAGQIRIRRVGADFGMFVRATSGDAWIELNTVTRADLPALLQVGFCMYGQDAAPNLIAHFDSITFTTPP